LRHTLVRSEKYSANNSSYKNKAQVSDTMKTP